MDLRNRPGGPGAICARKEIQMTNKELLLKKQQASSRKTEQLDLVRKRAERGRKVDKKSTVKPRAG
jgi:hypothetical protein